LSTLLLLASNGGEARGPTSHAAQSRKARILDKRQRKPPSWNSRPEAYLGRDTEGRTYWLLGGHVFSYQDGDKTLWVCSYAAFGQLKQLRNIDAA
jgi:hypothetical protein